MKLTRQLERLEKRAAVRRRYPECVQDMIDAELCEVIGESTGRSAAKVAALTDEQLRELA